MGGDQTEERRTESVPAATRRSAPERTLQAKLVVGRVDDPEEAAADVLAARAMSDLHRRPSLVADAPSTSGRVRRASRPGTPRGGSSPAGTTSRIHRASRPVLHDPVGGGELDGRTTGRIQAARGRGDPLPDRLQRSFEESFGQSLDDVRIHRGTDAADLSASISARAFTTGSDIFFGGGEYRPEQAAGQELIAHEVAHTVQQGATTRRMPVRREPEMGPMNGLSPTDLALFESHLMLLRSGFQVLQTTVTMLLANASAMSPVTPGAFGVVEGMKQPALGALAHLDHLQGRVAPLLTRVKDLTAHDPLAIALGMLVDTVERLPLDILKWRAMILATGPGVPVVGQVVGEVVQSASMVAGFAPTAAQLARGATNFASSGGSPKPMTSTKPKDTPPQVGGGPVPTSASASASSSSANGSGSQSGGMIGDALSSSGDNKEPKSYANINTLGAGYETESTQGSPVAEAIIEGAHRAVAAGRAPSVAAVMIKSYGWKQSDVDKYISGGHKALVRYVRPRDRVHYVAYDANPVRYGLAWENLLDTSDMFSKHSGKGFGIYVMDPGGTIYVGEHQVGLFHHSSFLSGANVAGGGEIEAVEGKIKTVTNKTGHYRSDERNLWQVLDELKSRGISLSGIKVCTMAGQKCGAAQFYAQNMPVGVA